MIVDQTEIKGVLEITPCAVADARGSFVETWHADRYTHAGIGCVWVQDNQSRSARAGTLRGLHLQTGSAAQTKLVRVCAGRIFAVAVDLRPPSSGFRRWVGRELTGATGNQLFVPRGFAFGFLTLEDDCVVAYKVDAPYTPEAERTIAWNDPQIAIAWPLATEPFLSAKDASALRLAELPRHELAAGD